MLRKRKCAREQKGKGIRLSAAKLIAKRISSGVEIGSIDALLPSSVSITN